MVLVHVHVGPHVVSVAGGLEPLLFFEGTGRVTLLEEVELQTCIDIESVGDGGPVEVRVEGRLEEVIGEEGLLFVSGVEGH
ncbi:MAG: hypothetical protein ACMG6E_05775 [Candidatus Roizmanbacteria bacterium]